MKTMRDNYLGYEIDFSLHIEGYRVMIGNRVVYQSRSYDDACLWIEEHAFKRVAS
jgi:hypothetical protein